MNEVMAGGTIALALFALAQIFIIRDFNRRSLRAYVCVTQCHITLTNQPEGMVEIRNSGQTPAYNIKHWIGVSLNTHPLTGSLEDPKNQDGSIAVLGKDGVQALTVILKKPLEGHLQTILGTPKCTPYVYGKITYEDIYGNEWETNFRCFWGGVKARRGVSDVGLLYIDAVGNRAT